MWNLFDTKDTSYNLRAGMVLALPAKIACGENTLIFRAILAWNNLPKPVKDAKTPKELQKRLCEVNNIYCK